MAETKADRKHRHHHQQHLGGVTHGVHHGIAHGHHVVTPHRNVHQNGHIQPNPHKGGANGWVYTTRKGDSLSSLQNRAWAAGGNKQKVSIWAYANNNKLLRSQGVKSGGFNPTKASEAFVAPLRPGTRIIL